KYDQHSIHAQPKFMNESGEDYRLYFDSPARGLGIEDIDFANMGLLKTYKFGHSSDPLEYVYPISPSGETISFVNLESSQTHALHMMGRTETGYYVDIATSGIEYESSQPGVATVNSSGLITAVGPGVSMMTVTVRHGTEEYKNQLHVIVDDLLNTVHVKLGA